MSLIVSSISLATFVFPWNAQATLILTQVIARHGDRTMEMDYTFPNNPFGAASWYPYGPGELNLVGKKKMLAVGKALRRRYDELIGDGYYNGLIEAVSSEYKRSVMSLQVILAGLFPPKDYTLDPTLNWIPIPFKYVPFARDKFIAVNKSCPKIYLVKTEADEETLRWYKYLTKYSGMNVTSSFHAQLVFHVMQSIRENGDEVPEWVKAIWPEPLTSLGSQIWSDIVEQSLPDAAGNMLRKLNENAQNKIDGVYSPKLVLYSAHDVNLVVLLGAFRNFHGQIMKYSAYMMIELHKIEDEYYIKVMLENYNEDGPEMIKIPGCLEFCQFDVFVNKTKIYYLVDNWCN